ncbi:MAG: hypothetical protein ACF8TS_06950 [Maioricimonas sp. JB049]
MAVARVEWQCPRCEKRYAIREDIPEPECCPACQERQRREIVEQTPQLEAAAFVPATPTHRRYQPFRIVALAIQICAVLTGVIGFVGLTMSVLESVVPEAVDNAAVAASIYGAGYFLVFVVALLIYAAGGALELLIEIEHHTRLHRPVAERE